MARPECAAGSTGPIFIAWNTKLDQEQAECDALNRIEFGITTLNKTVADLSNELPVGQSK
jgi:hypothetical protein